jgi:hypothetical protein
MVVCGDVGFTIVSSGITGNEISVVSVVRGISIFGIGWIDVGGLVVSMGRTTSGGCVVPVGTIKTGSITTGEGAMVSGGI